jgi:hypothetical protein
VPMKNIFRQATESNPSRQQIIRGQNFGFQTQRALLTRSFPKPFGTAEHSLSTTPCPLPAFHPHHAQGVPAF